ncbi:MAG: hypothetical protein K2I96_14380, partial [Lachnospiraceae bacterium]|nr:hypothetical protein [Lachnospiraceae bacterium]
RTYRRQYERDLAQKDAIIEEQGNVITEKENVLAEQERLLADKDAEIARLRLALAEAGRQR